MDEEDLLRNAVVGYGRIVRDEEGNVIDIILPEDEAPSANANIEEEDEEEEDGPRVVEAKTDVVRCEFATPSSWGFKSTANGSSVGSSSGYFSTCKAIHVHIRKDVAT